MKRLPYRAAILAATLLAAACSSPTAPDGAADADAELSFLLSHAGAAHASGRFVQQYYHAAIRQLAEELGREAVREQHQAVLELRQQAMAAARAGDRQTAAELMAAANALMLETVLQVLGSAPVVELLAAAQQELAGILARLDEADPTHPRVQRVREHTDQIAALITAAEQALAANQLAEAFEYAAQARLASLRLAQLLDRLTAPPPERRARPS